MWRPWAIAHLSVCLRPPVGFIIHMATLGSFSRRCLPESTSWLLHSDRLMPCWLGCDGSFQLACFQGSSMVHWDYSWAHWLSLFFGYLFKKGFPSYCWIIIEILYIFISSLPQFFCILFSHFMKIITSKLSACPWRDGRAPLFAWAVTRLMPWRSPTPSTIS